MLGAEDLVLRAGTALHFCAIEAYRAREISAGQVRMMLGFASRWEVEEFLRDRNVHIPYTEADVEVDVEAIRRATVP